MSSINLRFRVATPDDAPQIQQLVQAAFRAEDSRENWTGDMSVASEYRIEVEEVMATIVKPDSVILLATDNDGVLVGSAEASKRSAELGRISMLAVDQRHHRGGLGRRILAEGEDYCRRTWGVSKMGLNTLSTRPELILWYIRRGYRKTGETSPFPYARFPGRVMPDGMNFVELEKDL
ncbi:putative N-acetyltransferase, GNAT family [Xylariaceae sp. FL1272]|nr:putative N-acetyltransferase, GNAT family [Xylariaceae sp. FL1272]